MSYSNIRISWIDQDIELLILKGSEIEGMCGPHIRWIGENQVELQRLGIKAEADMLKIKLEVIKMEQTLTNNKLKSALRSAKELIKKFNEQYK